MRIYTETGIENFEAWSGAKDTREKIIKEGKAKEFDDLCEELFPNGCSETELNDYLWFDSDSIYEMLNIKEEE